jgi:type II secretory pathway pseudopilin PulG
MQFGRFHHRPRRRHQSGYILLILIFMLTLMIVAMAATAPSIAQQIKRDREEEMIHRGAQYARAIKRYFRKFGRYPTSLEQLENTNDMRFLRKAYKDPMSKDGKWRLLHPGDVKIGNQPNIGTPVSAMGSQFGFGSGAGGAQGSRPGGMGSGAQSPGGPGGLQSPGGLSSSPSSGSSQSPSRSGFSTPSAFGNNQVIGGAIIGVASTSEKEGIHEFNEKKQYNEWYFVYDPTTDRGGLITGPYTGKTFAGPGGSVTGVPGTAGPGAPAGQQPGAFGQPSSFGQPGGFGQQLSPPQSQRPPQQ